MASSGLSPGRHTRVHAARLDRKRKADIERSQTPAYKRQRRALKAMKTGACLAQEVREGVMYKSNIDIMDPEAEIADYIPKIAVTPSFTPLAGASDYDFIYFDVETTDRTGKIQHMIPLMH